MQEHQVGSLNSCFSELQQPACAQRLELEDDHHGYIESRREQLRLQEELSLKEEALRELDTRWEKLRELKNYESTNSSALAFPAFVK